MARIDSILGIVVSQGANELRVGAGREPKMLAYGIAKRLSIPSTPADTLRELLGDILSTEREEAMRAKGRIEVGYDAGSLGAFKVTLTARADGAFDAAFVRDGSRGGAKASPPVTVDHAPKLAPPVIAAPAPASGILPASPTPEPSVEHVDLVREREPAPAAPPGQQAGLAGTEGDQRQTSGTVTASELLSRLVA